MIVALWPSLKEMTTRSLICISDRPSTNAVGLFGYLGADGEVRHLGIEGGSVTGTFLAGGLGGYNIVTISACYATGNATATGTYGSAGCLDGYTNGTISACYATGHGNSI